MMPHQVNGLRIVVITLNDKYNNFKYEDKSTSFNVVVILYLLPSSIFFSIYYVCNILEIYVINC